MDRQAQLATQLRDIKPLVEIADWSFYLYWGLVILLFIVLVGAGYFFIKVLLKMRRTNKRKEYLEALKRINWNDPKHAAYETTRLGRLILPKDDDKSRLPELYRQMVTALEKYKYKKEVDPIDKDTKAQFDLFVKACDESF